MENNHNKKQKTFVRVMAWVLAILMMGSCATLIVTLIMYMLGA